MAGIFARVIPGLALVLFLSGSGLAAPADTPQPSETSRIPSAAPDRAMPAIPPDEPADTPSAETPDEPQPAAVDPAEPLPTIEYDPAKLPPAVRRLREQIIAAAATGDPEKLRPIIEANGEPPQFSFNDIGDPIEYLKSLSGDQEGREILAILIEVLDAGYVHADVGTPDEAYIWPYFARYPVNALTPPQLVELFKLVFAGDYEDMKTYGTYISYRIGIGPDGSWRYFLVGD